MSDWALITDDAAIEKKTVPITGKMLVGREDSCDIVIPRKEISRKHAEIEISGEVLQVKDLGSVNGTFLNGERIEQADVKPGDELRFDIVVYKVDGPIIDPNKTVMRAAIDLPDVDSDATQVNPAIPMPDEAPKAEVKSEPEPAAKPEIKPEPRPAPSEPVELANEKTQIQEPVSAPPTVKPAEPEVAKPKSVEIAEEKTGVWEQTEETESGTLVMGAIEEPVIPAAPLRNTATIDAVKFSLIGTKAPVQGVTYTLTNAKVVIGRTENNDITIDESSVSSRHAELINQSGTWYVNDLGSLNGVFVNGKQVNNAALESGDMLWIGRVEFKFEVDNAGVQAAPSAPFARQQNITGKKKSSTAMIGAIAGVAVVAILATVFIMKDKGVSLPEVVSNTATPSRQQPVTSNSPDAINVNQLWSKKLSSQSTPSTPALGDVDGDKLLDVVVVDNKGWLRVYSGSQGDLLFKKQIEGKLWAAPSLRDLTGDGVKDIAIASDKGDVYVFNGKGQQLWITEKNLGIGGVYNRPVLHDVNDDKTADVIVASSRKGLVALDGNRGWELWNTASISNGMITSAPLITDLNADGVKDAVVIADTGQVLAVSFSGNRVRKLWEQTLPKVLFASPTFSKSNNQALVIIATEKDGVVALDATSGKRKWQTKIPGKIFSSPVAVELDNNGKAGIIVVDLNGTVYALSSIDGKQIWQRSLGNKVQASPALFGGNERRKDNIVILDTSGKVHILNSATGSVVFSTQISGADTFVASAVLGDIDNNATLDIVVASQNAKLFAYSLNKEVAKGQADWPLFLGNDSHGVY